MVQQSAKDGTPKSTYYPAIKGSEWQDSETTLVFCIKRNCGSTETASK
jgi:hypothetical protein